jgi:hypothetical protein
LQALRFSHRWMLTRRRFDAATFREFTEALAGERLNRL